MIAHAGPVPVEELLPLAFVAGGQLLWLARVWLPRGARTFARRRL